MTAMRSKRAYHRRQQLQDTAAPVTADTTPRMADPVASTVDATIERPQARPTTRDDPRARAAARAAQLRDTGALNLDTTDEFQAPKAPDGWEYEWKTLTVLNQENPGYQVQLQQRGFDPVPANRHPEMMPTNYQGETITRKGMILMERPKEINDEARRRASADARNQVRGMEEKLTGAPAGTLDRTQVSVKKSYSPVEIPAD